MCPWSIKEIKDHFFALIFEQCLLPATQGCLICPVFSAVMKQQLCLCPRASSCPGDVAPGKLEAALCHSSAPSIRRNWRLPGAASPWAPSGTEGPRGYKRSLWKSRELACVYTTAQLHRGLCGFGPAPGEEQPHASVQAWGGPAGEQLCGEGPGCPGGRHVDHEPAACPGCQEGQWHPGVH